MPNYLPFVKSIIIRADKGFYDHKTVEYLESKKTLFVIVAKLTKPIKRRLSGLSYREYSSGIETAEFMYQPMGWRAEYRFVVIRRPIPEDPAEQLTLFSIGKYSYQVIVTNTWKCYNGRAFCRTYYQRTKRRLPFSENPNKILCSQRGLFSHPSIFLQSHKLVQTTLSSKGVSEYDA